jgi:hypothetical protein
VPILVGRLLTISDLPEPTGLLWDKHFLPETVTSVNRCSVDTLHYFTAVSFPIQIHYTTLQLYRFRFRYITLLYSCVVSDSDTLHYFTAVLFAIQIHYTTLQLCCFRLHTTEISVYISCTETVAKVSLHSHSMLSENSKKLYNNASL